MCSLWYLPKICVGAEFMKLLNRAVVGILLARYSDRTDPEKDERTTGKSLILMLLVACSVVISLFGVGPIFKLR